MNIEQIAYEEASGEMLDYFSKEQLAGYLERCLSKLAEQAGETVAWQDKKTGMIYTTVRPEAKHLYSPLYTEAQLIAAQQRTAEACAKLAASSDANGSMRFTHRDEILEALSNGEWSEYL